jgi:hypothetical protein
VLEADRTCDRRHLRTAGCVNSCLAERERALAGCARLGSESHEQLRRSSGYLIEQRFCLFQIERVEAFGEPPVDWSKQFAGRIPLGPDRPRAAPCSLLRVTVTETDSSAAVASEKDGIRRHVDT